MKRQKPFCKKEKNNDKAMHMIAEALQHIHYGAVTIHVQDGHVMQIDTVQKARMN